MDSSALVAGYDMNTCLFCHGTGPFKSVEHIIPESLGNDDLILRNEVCDKCNQYFGSKVENFVLSKTPLAIWRTLLGIPTKNGSLPHVDLSQPKTQKGKLASIHEAHDNFVNLEWHDDGSLSMCVDDDQIAQEIHDGTRTHFDIVMTPLALSMMGRFLRKVGLELVCLHEPKRARSHAFDRARDFARKGSARELWAIYRGQSGEISDLREYSEDAEGMLETTFCYHYHLIEVASRYTFLALDIGTDLWLVNLNDPHPTPIIHGAISRPTLELIWYPPEALRETKERIDHKSTDQRAANPDAQQSETEGSSPSEDAE